MITGELKNKIDSLWEIFWTGGLTNPLDVIEQMTYLMFIHDLDDADNLHSKESAMLGLPYKSIFSEEVVIGDRTIAGNQLKWSVFHDFPAQKMYSVVQEWVFPFIKNLHGDKESAYAKYMGDAIFKVPTTFKTASAGRLNGLPLLSLRAFDKITLTLSPAKRLSRRAHSSPKITPYSFSLSVLRASSFTLKKRSISITFGSFFGSTPKRAIGAKLPP